MPDTVVANKNKHVTLLASTARTATTNVADQVNHTATGIQVVIDVTAGTAGFSVVPTIQGKDPLSGKYYTILAGAAITGTGTTTLTVYPGITVSANVSASSVLPSAWRVIMTHADAKSITYSVGAHLLG